MADHELTTSLEIGGPSIAKFTAAHTVRWKKRAEETVDSAAAAASMTRDELLDAAALDGRLGDVLVSGLTRSREVSDPAYRSALARLISCAFVDEAQIDETAYLASILLGLEPADLRILRAVADIPGRRAVRGTNVQLAQVTAVTGMSDVVIEAAIARLAGGYLLDDEGAGFRLASDPGEDVREWTVTRTGSALLELCGEFAVD